MSEGERYVEEREVVLIWCRGEVGEEKSQACYEMEMSEEEA